MWDTWDRNKPPHSAADVHGGSHFEAGPAALPGRPFRDDDHRAAVHTAFELILDVMGGFATK